MALIDELEPILRQITPEAHKRWEHSISDVPLEYRQRHAAEWNKIANEFFGSVDDLLTRFREFALLDAHDFAKNVEALALPGDHKTRTGPGQPIVGGSPMPGTAFWSIFSADAYFMNDVREMIHAEQWNSKAAEAFRDNFLKNFGEAADWQGAYLKELSIAAASYHLAVNRAKKAILFVAESCLAALKFHPKLQNDLDFNDDSKAAPWATASGATSTALTAVGLFLSGGAALVVGVASLLSGIYSFAKTSGTKPYLQVDYNDYPPKIISDTEYAIKALREWLFLQDDALADGLGKDLSDDQAFASPKLRLASPGLTPDAYKTLDIRDGDGKPPNQVVASIVLLARAGYYNLPGAAYEYDSAVRTLDACTVPGSMGTFFPKSLPKFNEATRRLGDYLRETGDALTRAGDAMLTAARSYQGTDEERADIISQINQIPPHHSRAPFH
ncbi:hypothetical protein [Rhizocola hellebori]|nr:hypothetical protein [Rhizocola hellebori]